MKRVLQVAVVLVAVLIVAAIVLPLVIDANQFRPALAAELTKALGREVKLGDLKLSLFSGGVSASGISIADDPAFQQGNFIRADSLALHVELLPLIVSRALNVKALTIDQPQISLIQKPDGTWNFSSLGSSVSPAQKTSEPAPAAQGGASSSSTPSLTVNLIKISNGQVSLQTAGAKPKVLTKVDVEVKDFTPSVSFPFSLSASIQGGGDVKLDGKAGPLNGTDEALTPFSGNLKLSKLNLVPSNFVEPGTGLSGLLSIDGTVASDGHALDVKGSIQGDDMTLAKGGTPAKKPVKFDFALNHDLEKRFGKLTTGNIHIGNAQASLTGDYRMQGAETDLQMKLAGPKMSIEELEAMLPALNIVLPSGSSLKGGTVSVNLAFSGPVDKLVADGSLALNDTQLTGFDLGSKMSTVAKLAGVNMSPNTSIQNLSSNIHSDVQGIRADNISLVVPSLGELSGNGTVSPSHELNFKMIAKLRGGGGVLSVVDAKTQGGIPFSITGTSSSPKFSPDVKALANQGLGLIKGDAARQATGIIQGLFGGKKKQ